MAGLPTTASVIARSTWYDFNILWDIGAEPEGYPAERPEMRMAYHRRVMIPYTQDYADDLVPALGITATSRVLVVGGGFGFLAEVLRDDYGLADARVVTLDPSDYIANALTTTEEPDANGAVMDVGLRLSTDEGKAAKGALFDGGARCRVRPSLSKLASQSEANSVKGMFPSSAIDFAITDDGYLNYHNDAEIAEIFSALDLLGAAQTWHVVYEDWGNARPLAEWKALKPAHKFIAYGSWAVA